MLTWIKNTCIRKCIVEINWVFLAFPSLLLSSWFLWTQLALWNTSYISLASRFTHTEYLNECSWETHGKELVLLLRFSASSITCLSDHWSLPTATQMSRSITVGRSGRSRILKNCLSLCETRPFCSQTQMRK